MSGFLVPPHFTTIKSFSTSATVVHKDKCIVVKTKKIMLALVDINYIKLSMSAN